MWNVEFLCRILTVSSSIHVKGEMDFDDLMGDRKTYTENLSTVDYPLYANSKLANALFSQELGRRLLGTNVRTYALDPGNAVTDISRTMDLPLLVRLALTPLGFMLKTPEEVRTRRICVGIQLFSYPFKYHVNDSSRGLRPRSTVPSPGTMTSSPEPGKSIKIVLFGIPRIEFRWKRKMPGDFGKRVRSWWGSNLRYDFSANRTRSRAAYINRTTSGCRIVSSGAAVLSTFVKWTLTLD